MYFTPGSKTRRVREPSLPLLKDPCDRFPDESFRLSVPQLSGAATLIVAREN
jgi:hypothetical protein